MSFTQPGRDPLVDLLNNTGTTFLDPPGTKPAPPIPQGNEYFSFAPDQATTAQSAFERELFRTAVQRPELAADLADLAGETPVYENDPYESDLLRQLQKSTRPETPADVQLSKQDLANILEGFAEVLRHKQTNRFELGDRRLEAEIAQMKELLWQAQETIISLLNDRVFDRARIAQLEAEARLIPDLQAQAHRSINLAARTSEFEKEVKILQVAVDRLRTSFVRQDQQPTTSLWQKLLGR